MRESYYCDKCMQERPLKYFTKYISDTSKARTCDCCQENITARVAEIEKQTPVIIAETVSQIKNERLKEKRLAAFEYHEQKRRDEEIGL